MRRRRRRRRERKRKRRRERKRKRRRRSRNKKRRRRRRRRSYKELQGKSEQQQTYWSLQGCLVLNLLSNYNTIYQSSPMIK